MAEKPQADHVCDGKMANADAVLHMIVMRCLNVPQTQTIVYNGNEPETNRRRSVVKGENGGSKWKH